MRVLVTGGAGFIGSNLLHHWARANPADELVTLDKLTPAGHRKSLADLEKRGAVRFVRGDICDSALVRTLVKEADVVIHLAAETHVDQAIADPRPFFQTNVLGTYTLLEAARLASLKRFHHVSTDEVFGTLGMHDRTHRFGPTSPYAPRNPYSASKAAADHIVRSYFETYGLPITISNCGNNYGPYQHPDKLIPLAIVNILSGRRVPLYGNGQNVRDWIHVEDHCAAIKAIARRGQPGKTYLVGANGARSNVSVVRAILDYFGLDRSWIEYVPDRPGHDLRYSIDSSATRRALGWKPRIPFDSGLSQTIRWYDRNRDWWRPFVPKGARERSRNGRRTPVRGRGTAEIPNGPRRRQGVG